jgi:hypothetical protein
METTLDSVSPRQRLDGASAPQQPDELVEERQLESAASERMAQVVATMTTRDRAIFDERITAAISNRRCGSAVAAPPGG